MFWITIFILINGFEVFWSFNTSKFLTACAYCPSPRFERRLCVLTLVFYIRASPDINVPIFFVLWAGWKLFKRTKVWKPHEMDFVTGIPTIEETEIPEEPPVTISQKIAAFLF